MFCDGFVIGGIFDIICVCGFFDVCCDGEIDGDVLFDFAFPIEDAEGGSESEIGDVDGVFH